MSVSTKPEAIYPTISVPPRVVTSASLSRCGRFAIASDGTAQAMEQDMPNDDPFDVRAIDRKALSPDEWHALKRRLIRRAQAERADAISAMFAGLFCWRRRASHADTAQRSPSSHMAAPSHGT